MLKRDILQGKENLDIGRSTVNISQHKIIEDNSCTNK